MKITRYARAASTITMLIAIAALTSCNKSDDLQTDTDNDNLAPITFNISSDDAQTKATSNISRYIMEVYSDASATTPVNCFGEDLDTHRSIRSVSDFAVILDTSINYTILFWADNGEGATNATYNADNLKTVALVAGEAMTEDAYFTNKTGKITEHNSIQLRRAVAKINYIQSGDYTDNKSKAITFTYPETYSFNCVDGKVASYTDTPTPRIFTINAVLTDGTTLGTDYTFASAIEGVNTLINITVKLDTEIREKTISNIPFNANKVTNITGQYSSNVQGSNFSITPNIEWDKPDNNENITQNQ